MIVGHVIGILDIRRWEAGSHGKYAGLCGIGAGGLEIRYPGGLV